MMTFFIRHGNFAVRTDVLDNLRRQHLIAIHFPHRRGRLGVSDNVSFNPEEYSGNGLKGMNALNRLAKHGGYIFAEYRGSTQILIGIVRPQQPGIFFTEWSDRNREAKLKTLKVSHVKWIKPFDVSKIPPKPARVTIAQWHQASGLVPRLLAAQKNSRKSRSIKPITLAEDLKDTAEYLDQNGAFDAASIIDARERTLALIAQRQGQPAFRERLLRVYENKCAICGCDVKPALEAAHIIQYRGPKTNHVQNGILLRADLHVLFDLGLMTINPGDMKVKVHRSLGGSYYKQFDGKALSLPKRKDCWPSKAALLQRRRQF
jgi:hypothetical protein